jgi:hypothetical protein
MHCYCVYTVHNFAVAFFWLTETHYYSISDTRQAILIRETMAENKTLATVQACSDLKTLSSKESIYIQNEVS